MLAPHEQSAPRPRHRVGLAGHAVGSAVFVAAVLVTTFTLPAASAVAESPDSVFHIDRNKNRNQVHYGVHVDSACHATGDQPVYNYWLRREEAPAIIQPLKYFQKAAYGFQKQHVEADGRIEVRLRALPDRELVIRLSS